MTWERDPFLFERTRAVVPNPDLLEHLVDIAGSLDSVDGLSAEELAMAELAILSADWKDAPSLITSKEYYEAIDYLDNAHRKIKNLLSSALPGTKPSEVIRRFWKQALYKEVVIAQFSAQLLILLGAANSAGCKLSGIRVLHDPSMVVYLNHEESPQVASELTHSGSLFYGFDFVEKPRAFELSSSDLGRELFLSQHPQLEGMMDDSLFALRFQEREDGSRELLVYGYTIFDAENPEGASQVFALGKYVIPEGAIAEFYRELCKRRFPELTAAYSRTGLP